MPYSKFFSLTAKTTLPILLILTLCRGPALGSGQTYFSIHLASFQHLRNANAQVNLLKERARPFFGKKSTCPEKVNITGFLSGITRAGRRRSLPGGN